MGLGAGDAGRPRTGGLWTRGDGAGGRGLGIGVVRGWGRRAEGLKVRGWDCGGLRPRPPSLFLSVLSHPSPLRLQAPSGGGSNLRRGRAAGRPRLAGARWLRPGTLPGSRGSAALTCAARLCVGKQVPGLPRPGAPPLLSAARGHWRGDSVRSLGLGPQGRRLRLASHLGAWKPPRSMHRGGVGGAAGSPRDPRRPPPPPAGGALATPGRLGERVLAPPLPSPRKRESMRMRAAERLVCRDSLLEHTPAFVPSVSLDPGTTPGFAVAYYLSANRGEVPKSVAAQDPPPVLFLQILCFPGHPLPSLRRKARDRSRFFLLLGVYQTREGYADEHGRCLVAGRRACVVLGRTNTSWPDKARLRKA